MEGEMGRAASLEHGKPEGSCIAALGSLPRALLLPLLHGLPWPPSRCQLDILCVNLHGSNMPEGLSDLTV